MTVADKMVIIITSFIEYKKFLCLNSSTLSDKIGLAHIFKNSARYLNYVLQALDVLPYQQL